MQKVQLFSYLLQIEVGLRFYKMNYKYAYIKDGEVTEIRPTVTLIPQEMWEKKGLLPYEENMVRLPDEEETDLVEGYEVFEDKVVKTIIERFHIPTLEQYKEQKCNGIKDLGTAFILSKYSLEQQMSAFVTLSKIETFYTLEKAQEIMNFTKTNFDKIKALEVSIRASATKEEVDTFNWVD